MVDRGLFANTTALQKWKSEDYLPTKLGGHTIPIVRNAVVGTLQDDRVLVSVFIIILVIDFTDIVGGF